MILTTLISAFVVLQPAETARVQIERQYKRWAKAARTNDVETILAILTPDYTLKPYTGDVIPLKKYEASLRQRKKENKPVDAYDTKILSLTLTGKTAQVTSGEISRKATVDPITKSRVSIVHIHRYLDTWVLMAGKWRLRSTVTTKEITKTEKL
jgi:hypothetical protein